MTRFLMTAFFVVTAAANAMALTIPSGSVISSNGEVMPAHETENAQRALDQNGVHVAGGVVAVAIGDHVITVDVADLRGKSRDEVIEIIGEAAVTQMEDMYADAEALVAEIEANGGSAFNAIGSTLEEEIDAILNENHDAIVGGSQAAADYLVENSVSCDAGGCYNDTVHPDQVGNEPN